MSKLKRDPGGRSVSDTHLKLMEILRQETLPGLIVNLGSRDWVPELPYCTIINCDLHNWMIPDLVRCDLDCGQSIPFRDAVFDTALASSVLEHLECQWHFFRETHRILRVGGKLMVDVPNILSPGDRELFYREGRFAWYGPDKVHRGHINVIPKWEIDFIAEEVGFKVKRVDYNNISEEVIITTMVKEA